MMDQNNTKNIKNCPISTCKSLCEVYNATVTTLESGNEGKASGTCRDAI